MMNIYRVYFIDGHGETVCLGFPLAYRAEDALNVFFRDYPFYANLPEVTIYCELFAKRETRVFPDNLSRVVYIMVPPEEITDVCNNKIL